MSTPRRKIDWTNEQDQMMVALRGRQIAWKDVAERVGRSVEACSTRYRKIVSEENRARVSRDRWTDADTAVLKQLLAEGMSPQHIANYMGKTRSAVYSKTQGLQKERRLHLERVPRVEVPLRCLEDRDRRLSAERSLTQEFFGDPRPGQSALDRKQGAFA